MASYSRHLVLSSSGVPTQPAATDDLTFSYANLTFTPSTLMTIAGPLTASGAVTLSASGTALTVNNNATISGNLLVSGTLTVNGSTTTISTTNLSVSDPLIALAAGNTAADSVDIGFFGIYSSSSKYAGLFRDASDSGKFKFFKETTEALTSATTITTSGNGYDHADVQLGGLTVDDAATIGSTLGVTGASTFTGATTHNGGVTVATGQAVAINGTATLTVGTGATTLGGSLNVTGTSTLAGMTATTGSFSSTLAATSDFSINTNKFNVTASSGNTTIAGTLGVTGATTLSSTASVAGRLTVSTGGSAITAAAGAVGSGSTAGTDASTFTFTGATGGQAAPSSGSGAGGVGSAFTFTGGTGGAANTGTGVAGAGGGWTVTSGTGGAATATAAGANGGAIAYTTGDGGAAANGGAAGAGGAYTLTGGAGGAASAAGSTAAGQGAAITITSGVGGAAGAGTGGAATGGSLQIKTGVGGAASATAAAAAGGALDMRGGTGGAGASATYPGATGGAYTLAGGTGGAAGAAAATGGSGGVLTLTGGAAVAGGATGAGGTGGALTITSGDGGAGGSTSGNGGAAGALTIAGGAGGSVTSGTGGNGGSVTIRGGAATGGGTNGSLTLGATNTSSIAVGASTIKTTLTGWLGLAENSSNPSTVADTGYIYSKDVSGITELFYYDSGGGVTQITSNGGINTGELSVTMSDTYTNGHSITVSAGPIILTHSSGTTGAAGSLSLVPGGASLLTMTLPEIVVAFAAGAYTGTPHGMQIDYSGITSLSNAADVNGITLLGKSSGNAGAGDLVGLKVDANWDKGLICLSPSVFGSVTQSNAAFSFNGNAASTLGTTAANLTVSTTTSGTLAVTSAGALTLTAAAASTWSTSSGALTITSAAAATWSTTAGALTLTSAAAATWSTTAGALTLTSAAAATWSTTAGLLTLNGASGIALTVADNTSDSFVVQQGSNKYIDLSTTDSKETLELGNTSTKPNVLFAPGGPVAGTGYSYMIGYNAVADTALSVGDIVYITSTGVAKADATTTSTGLVCGIVGGDSTATNWSAGTTVDSGDKAYVASVHGQVVAVNTNMTGWTVGAPVYLHTTAGAVTNSAPSASGNVIFRVGFVHTAGAAGTGRILYQPQFIANVI